MKKIKYILIIVILCIFTNVKAVNCSKEDLNKLKELAKQVEFKQVFTNEELDIEDGKMANPIYHLNLINYNEDLAIYIKRQNDKNYNKISLNEIQNEEFYPGDSISIQLYSYTRNSCTNDLLLTKGIKFEYYNDFYYYNKDKCDEYPSFKYCKEFMKVDKDFEEIDELFQEYIKDNTITSDSKNIKSTTMYIIIGVVVLLIVGLVIVIIQRKKKSDL